MNWSGEGGTGVGTGQCGGFGGQEDWIDIFRPFGDGWERREPGRLYCMKCVHACVHPHKWLAFVFFAHSWEGVS